MPMLILVSFWPGPFLLLAEDSKLSEDRGALSPKRRRASFVAVCQTPGIRCLTYYRSLTGAWSIFPSQGRLLQMSIEIVILVMRWVFPFLIFLVEPLPPHFPMLLSIKVPQAFTADRSMGLLGRTFESWKHILCVCCLCFSHFLVCCGQDL